MKTLVMGVLNVTPDSFSDGGRWMHQPDAIAHARAMLAAGADLLDIGGESTRPGAVRPDVAEELRRVLPVVSALAGLAPLSVDTMRAEVARAAIAAGARIVNDVSGGLADPQMLAVVAEAGVDYVCQHWRGHGAVMDGLANYGDVVSEVLAELDARVAACRAAGIADERIIIDPGLGFAKTADQNWAVLANLDRFVATGHRVLIGASRKRFLGTLLDGRAPVGRDAATAAITTICAQQGVWAVRTHEVQAQCDAIAVVGAIAGASESTAPGGPGAGPEPG